MVKKSKGKMATVATKLMDMPLPEPNRMTISIKKADNGGFVMNHYGVKGGKHFDKTLVAHNIAHAKQIATGLIK